MVELSFNSPQNFTRHDALDLARPVTISVPQSSSARLNAVDLAVPLVRSNAATSTQSVLVSSLRAPASTKYAHAFNAALNLVDTAQTRKAAFVFNSLRHFVPSDYRSHAQYALLMEQLADAQDAAGTIGKVYVSQPTEAVLHVASERLDHLEGMLEGLIAYMACLNNPELAAQIAARNGEEVVSQGRIDTAKSIVWAVTQAGSLINAMAGAICATVTHQGIVEGLQSGQLDASNPVLRARLDEHFAAVCWPHLACVQGDIAVEGGVEATVNAWNAWRSSECQRVYASIADVRPYLTRYLPEYVDALAMMDRLSAA